MNWIFEIDGESFADVIAAEGMQWTAMQLDSEDSGRDLDWSMDRPEVRQSRQLQFTGREKVPFERFHALALAVWQRFFTVRYVDVIDGVTSRVCYAAEITGATQSNIGGVLYYHNISLTVTARDAPALS